jgi:hypothetical protein
MTLKEAQQRAHYYHEQALALPAGPEQDEANQQFAYWQRESERLVNVAHTAEFQLYTTPIQRQVQEAQQPSQKKKHMTIGAVLAFIIVPLFVIGGGSAVTAALVVGNAAQQVIPDSPIQKQPETAPATVPSPEPSQDPSPVSTPSQQPEEAPKPTLTVPQTLGVEAAWKENQNITALPDGVRQPAPSQFMTSYKTPEDWLSRTTDGQGFTVVTTTDPKYNCGWKPGNDFGGCYNATYGRTIFLWWSPNSTDTMKEFMLAHEYSHYIQWYSNFDTMYSATEQGYTTHADFVHAVESDASCRVLSWGGYDKSVADASSAPCDVQGWHEGWLTEQAKNMGVNITDY